MWTKYWPDSASDTKWISAKYLRNNLLVSAYDCSNADDFSRQSPFPYYSGPTISLIRAAVVLSAYICRRTRRSPSSRTHLYCDAFHQPTLSEPLSPPSIINRINANRSLSRASCTLPSSLLVNQAFSISFPILKGQNRQPRIGMHGLALVRNLIWTICAARRLLCATLGLNLVDLMHPTSSESFR